MYGKWPLRQAIGTRVVPLMICAFVIESGHLNPDYSVPTLLMAGPQLASMRSRGRR